MFTNVLDLLSPRNLILFVIVFTRLGGLTVSAPLISSYPMPVQVKTWFMATVAFVIFPIVMAKASFQLPSTLPELTIILLKEFLIGFLIGFVSNVVFIGVEIASNLVSMQTGLNSAQALNPTTGESAPVLAQAYSILAGFVFIGLNAFSFVFAALLKSFSVFPPGYGFIINGEIASNMIYVTSQIFTIGLGIAMPIYAVMITTDILLGVVAKMMPKINIFMVSLPIKIYLGFILLFMLAHPLYTQISKIFQEYLANVLKILGG